MRFISFGTITISAALSVDILAPSTLTSPLPPRLPACQRPSPRSPSPSLEGLWLWRKSRWKSEQKFSWKRSNFFFQLKVNEGSEVITLKDSPCMYNTPCYLLPSSSTTTSTATPPYLPTTPTSTSTPLLPTPTIVHHLTSSTPQPAPYFALTGTVKPQQHCENTGRFSSLRCVSDTLKKNIF